MPNPVILYNIYRNAMLSLIWQRNGVNIIPNITWPVGMFSDIFVEPYVNCQTIVVSNIGLDKLEKLHFENELNTLLSKYHFVNVLVYGTVCKACDRVTYVGQYINARK